MRSNIKPIDNVSWVRGTVDKPLIEQTISALLKSAAAEFGGCDAAIFCEQNVRWTYQEFDRQVDYLAGGLYQLGFQKGERLGIWSPNRYEWLLAQFATARLGVILVNINPAYRIFELEYVLNKVGCRGLILSPRFKATDYAGMIYELAPELDYCEPGKLKSSRLPLLEAVICMGEHVSNNMLAFDQVMKEGHKVDQQCLDDISSKLDRHDPINIQFTSGTTGQPKGACLTHHNIVNNAHFVTDVMKFSSADRLCIPVPFYHCFGMVMGTLGCVTKAAAMVIPGEGFDARATLQAVSDEKCTALFGVPTMFLGELDHPEFDDFDLSRLRTGIMAGAPCPIEVMKRVQRDMNMTGITIAYGMTETSPVSFQSHVDDPVEMRVSSVGRIHPHVEVKIVDERGHAVPVGEQGELWTRGYSVMKGYWADEEETAAAIDEEGWMHTGDLARLDGDGYCNITGRLKDMVCRGGENIYPREIEEFLYTHPAVSQVQVFGIPDVRYGEVTVAWIILKENTCIDERDIKDFCRKRIAHYKIPTHICFVDEIPMTVTGKPQKFIMREEMMKRLGIEVISTA